MAKLRLFVIIFIFFIGSLSAPVFASDQFATSFNTTYSFDSSGTSTVKQDISITNKLTAVYASVYKITLKGETPNVITGTENGEPLQLKRTTQNGDTTIEASFKYPATGKGDTKSFTLNYSGKPADKEGQVWQVSVPRFDQSDPDADYRVELYTPLSFGAPAFVSPLPTQSSEDAAEGRRHFIFEGKQVAQSGVVAVFGNFQTLDFSLKYHLQNESGRAVTETVALPPDTAYQRMFYDSVDPHPQSVDIDADGNWLAKYLVPPRKILNIVAIGQVHLLSQPLPSNVHATGEQMSSLLQPQMYWPADDPTIKKFAQSLATPDKIYDYVVSTLSYDYTRLNTNSVRKGALNALNQPTQSLCTEYTDVFISLARAAGVPAREVNGYALSSDSKLQPLSLLTDVLHAWPEYWDVSKGIWKPVDPTWGDTAGGVDYFHNFDFSHFVFSIHGQSSTKPFAAGMYKLASTDRDVDVRVGEYRDYTPQNLKLEWQAPRFIFPYVKNKLKVKITNPNGIGYHNLVIAVRTTTQDKPVVLNESLPSLAPYGSLEVPIDFSTKNFLNPTQNQLSVSVGGMTLAYNVSVKSFLLWYVAIIILSTTTLLTLAGLAAGSWHLYIQRRKG